MMTEFPSDLTTIRQMMGEMQELLDQLEAENADLSRYIGALQTQREAVDRLTFFFEDSWLEYRDQMLAAGESTEQYPLLAEDPIYNALYQRDRLIRQLVGVCADYLAPDPDDDDDLEDLFEDDEDEDDAE